MKKDISFKSISVYCKLCNRKAINKYYPYKQCGLLYHTYMEWDNKIITAVYVVLEIKDILN